MTCLPVLAIVALVATASPALAMPANVKIVSTVTQSGVPSPDGRQFLYAAGRGELLMIADASTGSEVTRVRLPAAGNGYGIQVYAWAPSGREIAFSIDTGEPTRTGVYIVELSGHTPVPRRIAETSAWQLRYDASGTLIYLTGAVPHEGARAAAVWRAGEHRPLLALPEPAPGTETGQELHRTLVITTVKRRNQWSQLVPDEIWMTDLATGHARKLPVPPGSSIDVAPTEDRACYRAANELYCFSLAGGTPALALSNLGCLQGGADGGYLPWSPGGTKIATFVCTQGGPRRIAVHDLATGATTTFPDEDFGWVQFQTDDQLLLLYGKMPATQMPFVGGRVYGALGRLDVTTGTRTILAADTTQFPHASPIPGRTDVLYAARDTDDGLTYLSWIDCRAPVGPARAMAIPRDGIYREWFEHGGKKLEAHYAGGQLDGPYETWDWSGRTAERGSYAHGAKDGAWTTYFPDGKQQTMTTYRAGQREGIERSWWHDGKLAHEVTWHLDRQHGRFRSWYEDGKPGLEGEFRDGLREGVWKTWYQLPSSKGPHLQTYAAGKVVP